MSLFISKYGRCLVDKWSSIISKLSCVFPKLSVYGQAQLSLYGHQMVGVLYFQVLSTYCRQMVLYNFQFTMCGPQIVCVWSGTNCLRMATKWSVYFISQYGRRLVDKWSSIISKLSCVVPKLSVYGEAKRLFSMYGPKMVSVWSTHLAWVVKYGRCFVDKKHVLSVDGW